MSPRIHIAVSAAVQEALATIIRRDERTVESYWSHPDCPVLVFADHKLPGASVSFHGGPIGTGLPIQLIYWGGWWKSAAGAARRAMINDRTQRLINSEYFSELTQYGIDRPTWRDPALICTKPYPPSSFTNKEEPHVVRDLIDHLIDDDVFPDPDDGRIAFVVLMPEGFKETIGDNGQHTSDFDQDFLDRDYYWVAWIRYFADPPTDDPENTIRTLSHELVEMFTDPEADAWYVGSPEGGEIGDAAQSPGDYQTALVNGARASAYWSNRHAATVIPIDRDYKARIRGAISVTARRTVSRVFRPDPAENRLCSIVPECCFEDRDYAYTLVSRDESVSLRMETLRYYSPVAAWTINGRAVSGKGSITVRVIAETFTGRATSYTQRDVSLGYDATDSTITLAAVKLDANFDVEVGCSVNTALLRNGFGTLSPVEATIVIAELFTIGFLILRLAVHLFRYGSIQYSSKLSIAGTFRKRSTPAGK
ncbi:hypothetical protein SAMN04487916_104142 [Arthrobacter sp. ov407]|uniref:hypothetical protein n=1 Tax=Arthrobacter sp. ov407 TaxID=1761748 RepID=UPI00088DB653|nr:hypothetical protein [Arthrobacter sp. ov407]SDK93273.1 hypothetical protein SAMN04487916_104142 [Arthrobacter sp. ov407]